MEADKAQASESQSREQLARAFAAALVRNFAAVDDVLKAQYETSFWATPDRVAEQLQTSIADHLLEVVKANRSDTLGDLIATLGHAAGTLGHGEDVDPWDVLAFRAPVDFRSHRVLLTDPPALSPEVRAVQAQLLRRGVAVLGEHDHGGQRTVEVSSYDSEWAYTAVEELLPDLDVDWLAKTAREIKPAPCAGWREKGNDVIRLWVWLEAGEHIDEVVGAEDDTQVAVLAFVCTPAAGCSGQPRHEPVNIHLCKPLGNRVVVDGFSGDPVPSE